MNMKLSEWNKSCEYAIQVAKDLTNNGIITKMKVYTMFDGRKGIELQTFDNMGNFFDRQYSGICESSEESNSSIDRCSQRIKDIY